MKIDDAVKKYELHLNAMKCADNTKKSYITTVQRFINKSGIVVVDDISSDLILYFISNIEENGAGGQTINQYKAALRSFFYDLYQSKYCSEDYSKMDICKGYKKKIADSIRGINQSDDPDEPSGKSIPKKYRDQIIQSANQTRNGMRNSLMLNTGFICGFRIGDLVNLKVKNFDFCSKSVKVYMQKTKKKVEFSVGSDTLLEKLKCYIDKNKLSPDDYLFQKSKGGPMTTRAFEKLFRQVLIAANLPAGKENDGYASHDLRRTCATELWESGKMDLKEISLRLGHSSVEMTEKYLRIIYSEKRAANISQAVCAAFG